MKNTINKLMRRTYKIAKDSRQVTNDLEGIS